jgi:hypothetical protein
MDDFIEQLQDLVKHGLIADIFRMERSYMLLKNIGTNAHVINAPSAGNFGELFGSLQVALQTDTILAVTRLYDPPYKVYPNRCIRRLLDLIEKNRNKLPKIIEIYNLKKELHLIKMDRTAISLVDTDEPAFALELVKHFRSILEHPLTINTLQKLKDIRDKSIAHNEYYVRIQWPTWLEIERLIQHAKELAGILGWAYLNTVYMHNGNYILTSDAERPSNALNRLLKKIIPNEGSN